MKRATKPRAPICSKITEIWAVHRKRTSVGQFCQHQPYKLPFGCRRKTCRECFTKRSLFALRLEGPATPVEASVNINVPGVGLLATPLGRTTNTDVEVRLSGSKLLGKEMAGGAEALARLLKIGSLKLDATTFVHAEHREEGFNEPKLLVYLILLLGKSSA